MPLTFALAFARRIDQELARRDYQGRPFFPKARIISKRFHQVGVEFPDYDSKRMFEKYFEDTKDHVEEKMPVDFFLTSAGQLRQAGRVRRVLKDFEAKEYDVKTIEDKKISKINSAESTQLLASPAKKSNKPSQFFSTNTEIPEIDARIYLLLAFVWLYKQVTLENSVTGNQNEKKLFAIYFGPIEDYNRVAVDNLADELARLGSLRAQDDFNKRPETARGKKIPARHESAKINHVAGIMEQLREADKLSQDRSSEDKQSNVTESKPDFIKVNKPITIVKPPVKIRINQAKPEDTDILKLPTIFKKNSASKPPAVGKKSQSKSRKLPEILDRPRVPRK